MISGKSIGWRPPAALVLVMALSSAAAAQQAAAPALAPDFTPQAQSAQRPADGQLPVRVAERVSAAGQFAASQPNEHPLMPCLRWAQAGLADMDNLQDYSATLAKRERVGNKLGEYEYMFVKVRHHPFSVYMYFLGPSHLKGQEVIFVTGKNNGNMWAHTVGVKDALVGTVSLKPDGYIAMQGQRYPLTEIGVQNLIRRLCEVAEKDTHYGECEVKFFQGAKINDKTCTCVQVVHPVARKNFLFHLARIFVDDAANLPVRYEAYDWPHEKGASPELMEEYTYLNLKLNNGFTDEDFDIHNPKYHFR